MRARLKRKAQELMLTFWLEQHFTKREILEIWLNRVYLGSGAWGMDAAAQIYFGVSARRVTLWQAAVLAGLPRAPSRFNPRSDAIGGRGARTGGAGGDGGRPARSPRPRRSRLRGHRFPRTPPIAPGWFADWAADQAQAPMPHDADATLRTTLDPRWQALPNSGWTRCWRGLAWRPERRKGRWWCWTQHPVRSAPWWAGAITASPL